jgi:hypothetical protein
MISENLLMVSSGKLATRLYKLIAKTSEPLEPNCPASLFNSYRRSRNFWLLAERRSSQDLRQPVHPSPAQSHAFGASQRSSQTFEYFIASPYVSVYTFFVVDCSNQIAKLLPSAADAFLPGVAP